MKKSYIAVIIITIIFHIPYLLMPAVNLEFAFADAAAFFSNANNSLIDQYFYYQANTLGIPYLGHLVSSMLLNINTLISIRLLNIFGILLLGYSIIKISAYFQREDTLWLLCLLLANPLIWVFSSRATADFFPMALGIFSLALLLNHTNSLYRVLISGVILGIAAVLKYHAILIYLFFIPFIYKPNKSAIINLLIILLSACAIVACYLLWVFNKFGFWVTPQKFQSMHSLNVSNWFNNFILYAGFLMLHALPVSFPFSTIPKKNLKKIGLLLVISMLIFFIGYIGLQDSGEMNLGPLDSLVSQHFLNGILLLLATLLVFPLIPPNQLKYQEKWSLITLVIILVIISLSRPAQRYLVFLLPFYLLATPLSLNHKKRVILATCTLFLSLDIFVGLNQYATGLASKEIGAYIIDNNIESKTEVDLLLPHVGNLFRDIKAENPQYKVITGSSINAIHSISKGIVFKRTYSIVPIVNTD